MNEIHNKYHNIVRWLHGYKLYSHEETLINELVKWANEPGIVAPDGDTEDECNIKAAFIRTIMPVYTSISSTPAESVEAAHRVPFDTMLNSIFSGNHRPTAVTDVL